MLEPARPPRRDRRSADPFRFSDVEEPLAARAEAMVSASLRLGRLKMRGATSWTEADEALFRERLGELYEARARLVRSEDV